MTVYKNDDALFGNISYRRQKVPYCEIFLKDSIDVATDDEIKIIGNYTKSSTTRTVVTGTDGAPSVGTDNFLSAGSTFQTDNVAVGDMLIIKDGDDIGSYIVLTIDSETQLSVETHAEGAVSFTGDTANTFEVGKIIFRGIIDKTDFAANQLIEIKSKAEELEQIDPTGTYVGYSEVIWGEMLKDASLSNVTINYTEDTKELEPDEDVEAAGWTPTGAATLFGSVDADDDAKYITSDSLYTEECTLGYETHGLSGIRNYIIYQIDLTTRSKYITSTNLLRAHLYLGTTLVSAKTVHGTQTSSWVDYTTSWTSLQYSQSDITNLRVLYAGGDGNGYSRISRSYMTIYYRSYDDFDDVGSYEHTIVTGGEKSLTSYGDLFALIEQQTWYLDADLTVYFNDGDKDSGENFAKTDTLRSIFGTRNNKSYTRVLLNGGYAAAGQLTSTTGSGFPVWRDTYSNIIDQTQLDNLAASLLVEQSANQYIIQIERRDATDGLYQVGETVSLPDDPDDISFSTSDRKIPTGEYILNKIDYMITDGTHLTLDIEIIDGLMFSNPQKDDATGTNAEGLAEEATVQVSQVSTGGGGGMMNLIDDTSPELGGDLSLNSKNIDFPSAADVSDCVTTVEDSDTKLVTAGAVYDGLALKLNLAGGEMSGNITMAGAQTVDGKDVSGLATAAEAVTAVANADSYLKNDANDGTSGDLTVANLITAGNVDGKDVSGLCTTAEAHAFVEANALTLTADVIFNVGQLFDGKDVSGLGTDAEAHAYVEATALTMENDITFNAGQTFDGKDVSTLGTDAEAHAYIEATALTLENDLAMGAHKITGVVDPVANQDAVTKKYLVDNNYTQAQVDAAVATRATEAEAHAYVEATALIMENDITFNAGQTFDGKDVSGLATAAEAHAYIEATALTLENDLAMGAHKITGVVDPVGVQDAVTKQYLIDNNYTQAQVDAIIAVHHNPASVDHDDRYYTEAETYTQAQVDALIAAISVDEETLYPTTMGGTAGFLHGTNFGATFSVVFSDINANVTASFFVRDGGDFRFYIIHDGTGANNGKTAGGNVYISSDIDGGAEAWDVGEIWDLPLANANILNIDEYASDITIADNSKAGIAWVKDNNAGGAAGIMHVYGFIMKRQ